MIAVAADELDGLTIDGLVAAHDAFFTRAGAMTDVSAGRSPTVAANLAREHLATLLALDAESPRDSLEQSQSALDSIEVEIAARAETARELVSDFEIEAVPIDNNGQLRVRPSFTVTNVLDMPIRIIGLEMSFEPTDRADAPAVQQTFQLFRGTAEGLEPGGERDHDHPLDFAVPFGSEAYKSAVAALGGYPTDPEAYDVDVRAYAAIPPDGSGFDRWNAEERMLTQEAARLRAVTERCEAGLAALQAAIDETETRLDEIASDGGSVRPLPRFSATDLVSACPSAS